MDGDRSERLSSLYRKEVALGKKDGLIGSLVVAPSEANWVLASVGALLTVVFLAILFLGSFARRERIVGAIIPAEGVMRVESPAAGTVLNVSFTQGQVIERGQVLLTISGALDSVRMGDSAAATYKALNVLRSELETRKISQLSLSESRLADLRRQEPLLRKKVEDLLRQIAVVEQQVKSSQQMLKTLKESRAKGIVTIQQVEQQNSTTLAAESDYLTIRRQLLDAQNDLAKIRAKLDQEPLEGDTAISDTREKLVSVQKEMVDNEKQRAFIIRAPRAGVIDSPSIAVGQSITQHQYLATIVPAKSELNAEFWVSSRSVGFMHAGMSVLLDYMAFPSKQYGFGHGVVISIAQASTDPEVVQAITGHKVDEPMFRVLVKIRDKASEKSSSLQKLRSGMSVEGGFLVERRSLIDWVLEPIYKMAEPK